MLKQKFLQPEKVLIEAGLRPSMVVADLGAGNGFFTIPASKIVGDRGEVWGVDILEEALGQIMSSARLHRCKNIRTHRCDLEIPGSCQIPDLSCDFVIVGKVLSQVKHPEVLVRGTYRILKTGGLILILEWKKEALALGPPVDLRLEDEKVSNFFVKQGFKFVQALETDQYHYGMVFQK